MGGNALKNTYTRRYNKNEYFDICDDVTTRLKLCGLRTNVVESYASKETFGDLDVVVELSLNVDYQAVVRKFEPREVVTNGMVISFEYREFQIDLIIIDPAFYDFALAYYSFNDLGNLVGRVAHRLGMSYGHAGLKYKIRNDTGHVLDEVVLTTNTETALTVLGYDYKRFTEGFDTITDIFEYAVSGEYFDPDIYLLENRNHKARNRDKKRQTYTDFLKYLAFGTSAGTITGTPFDVRTRVKFIESRFPGACAARERVLRTEFRRVQNRAKFNGDIVRDVTGLTGPALGEFIASFKRTQCDGEYDKREFATYVTTRTAPDIINDIRVATGLTLN